jgi:hypothetical protein
MSLTTHTSYTSTTPAPANRSGGIKFSQEEAIEKISHIIDRVEGITPDLMAELAYKSLNLKEVMTKETLKVMMGCATLFDRKQHDYGSRNIAGWATKNQNIFGVLVRLNDKIQRLANLNQKAINGDGPQVEDERLSDTAHDICNYGAILELLLTDRWK